MLVINRTKNGQIFKCDSCDAIHIEFKNIGFNFSLKQFDQFAAYVSKLDGKMWEQKNIDSSYKRKIIIPMGSKTFNMLLLNEELVEFNSLLNEIDKRDFIYDNRESVLVLEQKVQISLN